MGSPHKDDGAGAITVASLRETVRFISDRLRSRGRVDGAAVLDSAASIASSPHDELLAMREALVRTAPDWRSGEGDVAAIATRALAEAKRLAIRL